MSRTDLIRLAEAFGFRRFERNGVEVWYDPEGGHVSWDELPEYLEHALSDLIEESAGTPLRTDDAIALMKRGGNPFVDPSRS